MNFVLITTDVIFCDKLVQNLRYIDDNWQKRYTPEFFEFFLNWEFIYNNAQSILFWSLYASLSAASTILKCRFVDHDNLLFVCVFGVSLACITLTRARNTQRNSQHTGRQDDLWLCKNLRKEILDPEGKRFNASLGQARKAVLRDPSLAWRQYRKRLPRSNWKREFLTDLEVTAWIDVPRFYKNSKYDMFET